MAETSSFEVPPFHVFLNPILSALRALGGRSSSSQLDERVMTDMALPPAVLGVPHKADKPDKSEVAYRLAWARTYLRKADLLLNPSRGIWALSAEGLKTERIDEQEIVRRVRMDAREVSDEEIEEAEAIALDDLTLAPEIARDIRRQCDYMLANGELLTNDALATYYRRFRERFGPDVLRALDGERLLVAMHGRGGTKDSLVYWLEFKNDDEFPARFGSIAGGSALKFGLYQRADDGKWWSGSPNAQVQLSIDDAIAKASMQRDQLLEADRVLTSLGSDPGRIDFVALQAQVVAVAPDVAETAWGHKYLSLLHPTILDDYHAVDWQRHHLIKLLKTPANGRYANAGYFIATARSLDLRVNTLTSVLNRRDGDPHNYWRVGTSADTGSEWPRMRDGGFMSLGWTKLGDLSELPPDQGGRERLRALMAERYPKDDAVITRKTNEVFGFATSAREHDVVLAMDGEKVLGVGRIGKGYSFVLDDGPFGHRRPVTWVSTETWQLPKREGLQTSFVRLGRHSENLIEAERRLLSGVIVPVVATAPRADAQISVTRRPTEPPPPPLDGTLGRIHGALSRKGQVILYGPPGTGKTFWGEAASRELAARSWFNRSFDRLTEDEKAEIARDAVLKCAFHPAYGYEDFLEGYRPFVHSGQLAFERRDGVFKRLCARAAADEKRRHYFLLIDEINRGDVPRIFGELLTLLERDKRGTRLTLPLSGETFTVPANLYVIGTMNTADRSIALLDAALRRRFAFIELMPDTAVLDASVGDLHLGSWLSELNRRIVKHVGPHARHLQIGHSYLMSGRDPVRDTDRFAEIVRDDIIPLLAEYCYEDVDALAEILGNEVFERKSGRPNETLLAAGGLQLIEALLRAFSVVTATKAAAAQDVRLVGEEADEDGDAQASP